MYRACADRLIDLCDRDSHQIAESWYRALCSNSRTPSYRLMSREGCLQRAVVILKSLGEIYFAKNCDKAVVEFLDAHDFVEVHFARGIPLCEILYALVLLRRHLWLHAESEMLFYSSEDMVHALDSINRVLLVYDYAAYHVARKYAEMASRTRVLV